MDQQYLYEKWLKDELTAEEKAAFDSLPDAVLNKRIIEEAKAFRASHFSETPAYDTIKERLTSVAESNNLRWLRPALRIAGIFVIGVLLYFVSFSWTLHEVSTLASEKKQVELPDASVVTLNALSTIRFNKARWEKKREIKLNGEAFFEVEEGKVFDVLTDDGVVRVVGTEFNVQQRVNYFEVICYEGKVEVITSDTLVQLTSGNTFRLHEGIMSFSSTSNRLPLWTQNFSTFKSVPFSEVIEELERQYDIEIEYVGSKSKQLFTGGFVHDDLDNALNAITEPLNLRFKIESPDQVRLISEE